MTGVDLPLVVASGGVEACVGVLTFGWPGAHEVGTTEETLLVGIADLAAAAIAAFRTSSIAAERAEWAERVSHTDPLTGLSNARTLGRVLELEVARAQRQQSEVSVALFDIDGFTQLNDDGRRARRRQARCARSRPCSPRPSASWTRSRARARTSSCSSPRGRPACSSPSASSTASRSSRPGEGGRDHGQRGRRPLPAGRHRRRVADRGGPSRARELVGDGAGGGGRRLGSRALRAWRRRSAGRVARGPGHDQRSCRRGRTRYRLQRQRDDRARVATSAT